MGFNEDPLDLLEDDDGGVDEMILLFDDEKEEGNGFPPQRNGCMVLLFIGIGGIALGALCVDLACWL